MRFIREAVEADKPFFVWHNTTRMHSRTSLSPEYDGVTGYGLYADGMKELDDHVNVLLDLLGELMAMKDWLPTIMAQLGRPNLKEELRKGLRVRGTGRRYKVHLDGFDQTPMITGTGPTQRATYYYFTETTFHGLRFGDWKFLFKTQDRWFNIAGVALGLRSFPQAAAPADPTLLRLALEIGPR